LLSELALKQTVALREFSAGQAQDQHLNKFRRRVCHGQNRQGPELDLELE